MTRLLGLLTFVCVLALTAVPAFADAPDSVPSATTGTLVTNGDGSRTLTVQGGWAWSTHHSNCNTDRAGAGVSLAWNDPTQPGNKITGAGALGDFFVGTPTDNVVHPTPGPVFNDTSVVANWRGGCGTFNGTYNTGTWGPFTHTYPASVKGPISVCPIMYDVHGGPTGSAPSGAKEIIAGGSGHNDDDSLEKNGGTPQGNGCFLTTFASPHLSIVKEVSKDGGASWAKSVTVLAGDSVKYRFTVTNDGDLTANLTNVHVNELTGIADCDSSLHAVSPAGFAGSLAVGASAVFTCDHTMGNTDLHNTARAEGAYSGQADPVISAPDSADVHVNKHHPVLTTNVASATIALGHSVTDTATLTGGHNLAGQTVTFAVYGPNDPTCSGAATALGSGTIDATNHATSGSFTPTAAGNYFFVAHYAGDAANDSADGACGDANETVKVLGTSIVLTKDADQDHAYDGDKISFTIKATNTGQDGLTNVTLVDAIKGTNHSCESVTGPSGDDGDNVFEPGETWKYVCSMTVVHGEESAAHQIVNVAHLEGDTVTGGDHVSSNEDDALVPILHPAIAIDKTGPATGQAGDKISYVLTVTNPGDDPFTEQKVVVSDQQCNGDPVTLIGKGGDASPASLDPGDAWTYSCSVQTALGDTAVHNIGHVDGCDRFGKCVSDDDDADTTLTQPGQLVLPERVTPGAAKLAAPTGCITKVFNARVRGSKIATVTFMLDGKVVKRFRKPLTSGNYSARVDPQALRIGVHRLVVKVTFQSASHTKPMTIRRSFQRCTKKLSVPRFTG